MSKRRFERACQRARALENSRGYLLGKQAGAVEEALRCRGVIARVKPSRSGRSLLVQVVDPDAPSGLLSLHAGALADALLADRVSILGGWLEFVVVPEWSGPEDEEGVEWITADDPEPWPPESLVAQAAATGDYQREGLQRCGANAEARGSAHHTDDPGADRR